MSMSSVRRMAAIVDQGKDNKAVSIFHEYHLEILLTARGHGTASSAIMDCLGLDEPEKDLVLGIMTGTDARQAMGALKRKMEFDKPGHGIVLPIPLPGVSIAAPNFPKDWDTSQTQIIACAKEDTSMPGSKHCELIATVVNTDLSAPVTEAARKAGCHGDTLVKARGIGTDEGKKLFGLTLSQEKAILLILTPVPGKQPMLKAIREMVLQEIGEHAVILSMPVGEVQRISGQDLTNRPGG